MSNSELSDAQSNAIPDDATITSTLRRVVRDALKKDEDMTLKIARSKAEEELGLDAGFFKSDAKWKERSSEIVTAAAEEPDSPVKPKKPASKKPAAKAGSKRKSADAEEKPKKRARKSPVVDSDEEEDGEEEEAPKPKARGRKARKSAGDSDDEGASEPEPAPKAASSELSEEGEDGVTAPVKSASDVEEPSKAADKPAEDNGDESDMSSLIDDPPPPKKKRGKKSTSPAAITTKKKAASKAKPAKSKPAGKDLTPDEEEIKRLQGWLVKCGIRKLWHRELAPYDTPKAKISHLKGMLSDAGMTGRYSVEKARSIKEARELRDELEAVEEFSKQWGKEGEGNDDGDDGDEEKEETKPQETRRLPKGLVDFGDSGDEPSD